MLDQIYHTVATYMEMGLEFASTYLMTFEGITGLIFGMFVVGLIASIRS